MDLQTQDRGDRRRGTRRLSDLTTAVLEACPMPVLVKDAGGVLLFANGAAAELFARPVDELLGLREPELFPPDIARRHEEEDASVLDGRTCYRAEETLDGMFDGRSTTFLVRKVVSQDARGQPLIICTMTDVRALKHAEEGARTAEERDARTTAILRSVLDASEAAIFSLDREYRYTSFNSAQARMVQELYGCEAHLGQPLRECIPEALWLDTKPNLDRALAGDSFVQELTSGAGADERTFEVSYRPVRDRDETVTGVGVFVRETTERRRAQAALEASEERFRQAQKMDAIGRLAGGVAHDLNNMLTVVLSSVSFMQAVGASEGPFGKDIEEIGKAAERAKALTSQLLSFSRRQPVNPVVFDVNQRLQELSQLLHRIIGEDVKMELELGSSPGPVFADPSAFDQALMNLIVNARDAMPGGGVITLRTGDAVQRGEKLVPTVCQSERTHTFISVTDTGHGMTPEVLEHLFEPFFTTKAKGKGTGLGLAIVYAAVRQAHGFIDVESRPQHGTTFTLYLPIATRKLVREVTEPERLERARPGERVLVVEDDAQVQAATVRALEQYGYSVAAASSAQEAFAVARLFSPNALVTDVVLPQDDGVKVAEVLRQQRPALPVLFISGFNDEVLARYGLEGDGRVLRKPFTPEDLAQRVRQLLDAAQPAAS